MHAKRETPPRGALTKIADILETHANNAPTITLGQLSDAMQERAFGLLLLILALPCSLPFVYVLPQIVALPMALLAWQMASGRTAPWLPETLRKRSMSVDALNDVIRRAQKYGGWLEALAHPRFAGVTGKTGMRIIGALLIIPSLSILVPLPLTNTVPGIGVAIAAVGLIERDGLFSVAGLFVGLVWVGLLVIGGPALIYFLISHFTG